MNIKSDDHIICSKREADPIAYQVLTVYHYFSLKDKIAFVHVLSSRIPFREVALCVSYHFLVFFMKLDIRQESDNYFYIAFVQSFYVSRLGFMPMLGLNQILQGHMP